MKQAKRNSSGYVTQRIAPGEFAGTDGLHADLPYLEIKTGDDAFEALQHADMLLRTGLRGLRACTLGEAGTSPEELDALQWCALYTMEIGCNVLAAACKGLPNNNQATAAKVTP